MAAVVALTAAAMRLLPDDPAVWHVDPATAERTGSPNDYLVAPEGTTRAAPDREAGGFAMPPAELLARFGDVALAQPRIRRIAVSPDELRATYVQRSRLFGFPDYVSVRAVEVPGGSSLIVWSRSRFGHDDAGVNRGRVEKWLAEVGDSE